MCGWTQKKRLEILFPAVVVTFGLRSSANRRVKVPSVIIQKVKDNLRPKILPRVPSTLSLVNTTFWAVDPIPGR